MNLAITLYHFENTEIRIDVEARFDHETLIIDGYDMGKRVEEYWGHTDYEYVITIPPASVQQLFFLLEAKVGDKENLLQQLVRKFNTNSCFSEIRKLLDDHQIACEGFSWR